MPPLMRQIETIAPGVRINAKAVEPDQLKYLFESGLVDIGVGYVVNPPGELRIRQAFEENLVCIARAGHPTIQGRLSLEQFTANPHVQIRPGDMRYALLLERALSQHGLEAAVGAIVHDFILAPEIVASTDMIAVVPERMARRYQSSLGMQALALPVDVPPLNFSMIWHERTHREPLYQWLRELVLHICEAL
jgi:DNA-binding transcriptional LysR family regulator